MKRLLFTVAFSMSAFLLVGQHYVDGTLLYHQKSEYPIPEVEATLYDASGNVAGVATTDVNGYFSFDNVPEGVYQLGFETNLEGATVGINDALNVLYHILGIRSFTPMQLIAMDVTADGQVNMADFNFILIQYFIFGRDFPAGDWVFEDVEVSTSSREGAITIGGSRTGDTEGILVPTGRDVFMPYQIENAGFAYVAKGDLIHLPLNLKAVNQEFMGYGLVVTFDPSLVELVNVEPAGADAQFSVKGNEVRMSWLNTALDRENIQQETLATFTVRLLTDKLPADGNAFVVQPESHVINTSGEKMTYLSFEMPGIKSTNTNSFAVYPNPATDFAKLSFELEDAAMLELYITNAAGQLVDQIQLNGIKGLQTKQISVAALPVGHYQLVLINSKSKQTLVKQKLLIH
ncbi:MAG: T9SS type A sorting domain-containing protein [Bacteroidales bacterium]|nr:T9SS type A sorting domain-containing protein [Bacteroidales bacterium]